LSIDVKARQTGYAAGMIDFARLSAAAFKTELSASRLLSRRTGCSPEQALRTTLELAAGAGSLADLLDQRAAQQAAAQ
jgi:ribonuclease HI